MMRYLKILTLAMIVIGLFVGPANAVQLLNRNGAAFGTGTSTSTSYAIALEVYSNSAGVSTIADDGLSRGLIEIALVQNHFSGDTVNLTVSSGNALFNSAGPGYNFGLCDVALGGGLTTCDPGEIVGFLTPSGATLQNLGISMSVDVVAPRTLWLVQWRDNVVVDNQYSAGESLLNGVGLFVNPGLSASCTNRPIVSVSFSSPRETTSAPFNFAYITPQFSGQGPGATSLTAELNTDTDFETFILGSGPNVWDPTEIYDNGFITISDNSGTKEMWIAYVAAPGPGGTISFNSVSLVGEPNVDYMAFAGEECDPNSDSTVWSCARIFAPGALLDSHDLELDVDGSSSNNPTNWKLTNFSLPGFCVSNITGGSIGVWYGGLEAFVPFVKGTTSRDYQTYVKLFNRYNKDAKVYVSTFADVAGGSADPIMIATGQIATKEVIPAGDVLTINDQDIGGFLTAQGITWDMSKGLPVKFNIRVPSQIGITTSSSSFWGYFSGYGSGYDSSVTTHQNPNDPFVEGIVVSIYPGDGQRTIPLKFKSFKNGEYSH